MEYKVGDKVRIKTRVGKATDYPFYFVEDMANLHGNVYTIRQIEESTYPHPLIKDDPHVYRLKGDKFSWHSSMFEKVEEEPRFKVGDIVRVLDKSHPIVVSEMQKLAGKAFEVVYSNDELNRYRLNGEASVFSWPGEVLQKIGEFATSKVVPISTEELEPDKKYPFKIVL